MSAADVTPERIAQYRAHLVRWGSLETSRIISLLDTLESACHERDDLRAKLDVMEENATTAAFDKISDHFAESERENDALRAEVERLRQGQAVEVPELEERHLPYPGKVRPGSYSWQRNKLFTEGYNLARHRSRLSCPAPSADVVTVPREELGLLRALEAFARHPERATFLSSLRMVTSELDALRSSTNHDAQDAGEG